MDYLIFTFQIQAPFSDVLQYELAEMGFDVFLETETGFETSILEKDFKDTDFQQIIEPHKADPAFKYEWLREKKQNWNELWEKFYDPIVISNRCLIRADFHEIKEKYEHELVIMPKMSFGTGHHATTALMVEHLLEMDLRGKSVADCGCGTGILGLMALKLGAKNAIACDIEEWAVENTQENAVKNDLKIEVFLGTAKDLKGKYGIILANITLNVLLEEMPLYWDCLETGGEILFSGFYEENLSTLREKAESLGLKYVSHKVKDRWTAARFC